MIIFNYFNQQLLSRTVKYVVLLTMVVSVVESIERLMLLPLTLTMAQNCAMWMLSWPMYTCMLLPACFYSAYLVTATGFARTQELAIMQFYASPRAWQLRSIAVSCVLSVVIFITMGWFVPWGQSLQGNFMRSLLTNIQLPKMLAGQFNHINIGGKRIVVFRDKQKGKKLFVASKLQDADAYALTSTSNMQLINQDQSPTLILSNGRSYTFDTQNRLKYAVSFVDNQIPLEFYPSHKIKHPFALFTSDQLMLSKHDGAQYELAWRFHLSLSLVVLCLVAMLQIDYLTCRRAASRVYVASGVLALFYYIGLLFIKLKSALFSTLMIHFAYGVVHMSVLLSSWLLVRFTRLIRVK